MRTRRRRNRANPPNWRRTRPVRRVFGQFLLALAPVVLLAAIAVAVVYVRLANGPVSLTFLKPAIERQIAAKLGGLGVSLSDVVLSLDEHGAELRLQDVQVSDAAGAPLVRAPLAAIEIDKAALLGAEISPSGITLIRPRLHVAYDPRSGFALSFAERAPPDPSAVAPFVPATAGRPALEIPLAVATGGGPASAPSHGDPQTVFEMIAASMSKLARSAAATGGLDRMGVRNALIVFEHAGLRSVWGMPAGDVEIRRSGPAVLVSGLATVAHATDEHAVLAFTAETSHGQDDVALTGSVRDMRPAMLAGLIPGLDALAALDAALSAEGRVALASSGRVAGGRLSIEIARGRLSFPPASAVAPVDVERGRLAMRFDAADGDFEIEPSAVAWSGGNELRFRGRLSAPATGGAPWTYDLTGLTGRLVAAPGDDVAHPVKNWSVRGRFDVSGGAYLIDAADVSTGGLRAVFSGGYEAPAPGSGQRAGSLALTGRISPGPVEALRLLWPANIAVEARAWMLRHIAGGRLTEGRIDYRWPEAAGDASDRGTADGTSIVLQGEQIAMTGIGPGGPLIAPKALVRFTGATLEMSLPTAELSLEGQKPLALRQVSFDIADVWQSETGAVTATLEGQLASAARLLAAGRAGRSKVADRFAALAERASGKVTGKLALRVPLTATGEAPPLPTGELRITDARIRGVFSGHDVSGGRFDVGLSDAGVTAAGEMLVDGVSVRLAWQHILDAPPERQPPLRLTASIDETDRDKLGLAVNHMLRGVVDVEVLLSEQADGGVRTEARLDARRAQITVESLAWVKPVGRDAVVDFEVAAGDGRSVVLDKLRIAGDGIAIQGRAMLDEHYNLRTFELPSFSIDHVTRLSIAGRLAENNIWRVDVKGQTFEGRSLFRSLFNAGRVEGAPEAIDPDQPGVDLQAEVATVLGFWSAKLSNVRMTLSKRSGRLSAMQLEGAFPGGGNLRAALTRSAASRRELHAASSNAGEAFRLVGFYPSTRRGQLELVVDLDRRGSAEKSGVLLVRNFEIAGDEVVREMAEAPRDGLRRRTGARSAADATQMLPFDWMRLPFLVGNGQFILRGAELRGPVVGATLQGKADFTARTVDLSGTYVPLQGLNAALGVIPGLGQILAGPKGEGVLGMKFAVRGEMERPEVLVNPLSIMAPGIFREIFQLSNPSLEVTDTPRSGTPAAGQPPPARGQAPGGRGWARRAFGESN